VVLSALSIQELSWVACGNPHPSSLKSSIGKVRPYEADWSPIQQQLIKLEEAKKQNPDLQRGASWLLGDTTRKIDQLLGLQSQAQPEK
jgi:hypothetical protein